MSNAQDLQEFVKEWFEPEDLIRVHLIKGKTRVCWTYTYDEVLETNDLDLHRTAKHGDETVNAYFQVHPVKDSDLDIWKKGGEDNTQTIRGVYLDLDIKAGSFQTQEEILEFVHSLEIQPTILVDSGSGGIHAYYAFEEDVDVTCKPIQDMFRSYVKAKAYPRGIDNLKDISREFRLPGSTRFTESGAVRGDVSVLEISGDRVDYEELRELVRPYYEARKGTLRKRQEAENQLFDSIEDKLDEVPGFLRLMMVEDWINKHIDWSAILQGWTVTNVSADGTRQWQRPGPDASARSATTDWPDSPNIMSLLSTADETGLAELHDEDVKLTKFRVILKLHFDDDHEAMFDYYIPLMKKNNKRKA